jgi:hypothetical protein
MRAGPLLLLLPPVEEGLLERDLPVGAAGAGRVDMVLSIAGCGV